MTITGMALWTTYMVKMTDVGEISSEPMSRRGSVREEAWPDEPLH